MADRTTSLENLQTALSMELTAVHQYLLHAHTLEDWGIDKLAAKMREEMQEELGHAGAFIDRIMFLGGVPRLEAAKTPQKAESLKALFEADKRKRAGPSRFIPSRPGRRSRATISARGRCSSGSCRTRRAIGNGSTCNSTCCARWASPRS